MIDALVSLPMVPDWLNATSFDKFVPLVIQAMMGAAAGVYDYFVPVLSGLLWIVIVFNSAVFTTKQFFPANWLSFLGMNGGGYWAKPTDLIRGIPMRLVKQIVRASIATLLLLTIRPSLITDTIINPMLRVGTMITEFVVPSSTASRAQCLPGATREFFDEKLCSDFANPIASIVYKNNQMVALGLSIINMKFPANGGGVAANAAGVVSPPDLGKGIFNFIVGLFMAGTFFMFGLRLASILLQGILDFCFAIILFPFKVFSYCLKATEGDDWFNPGDALGDIIESLRKLIVTMIVAGIATTINMILIASVVGSGTANLSGGGWGTGIMTILGSVLCLLIMNKFYEIAKEKIAQYGGANNTALYDLTKKTAKYATDKTTAYIKKKLKK
ncbi:MAG: hypothetical protein LBB23_01590 [Rickettsiales bacterium]|jgi:hypothetical protein|nr:hypothetical protein [Rickettsiales bacterium]